MWTSPSPKDPREERAKVLESAASSSIFPREDRHLARRPVFRMLLPEPLEDNLIAVRSRHSASPALKLRPRPLEAVVRMTHRARLHPLEEHVVLAVRCRYNDRAWCGSPEDNLLQRVQPVGIQMLDHLHQRRHIIAAQARVAIDQRSEENLHPS